MAEEPSDNIEAKSQGEEPSGSGGRSDRLKTMLAMVVVALLAAVLTGGTLLFVADSNATPAVAEVQQIEPLVFDLDPFTCNLQPGDMGELWLYNATISLQVGARGYALAPARMKQELDRRKAQIRSIISNCISSRSKETLGSAEGRDALRQEIIREVNTVLVAGEIQRVYFQKALYTLA